MARVSNKVKKAERAEMAALKGGASHRAAEQVEKRALRQHAPAGKGKVKQREYPAPHRKHRSHAR